MSDAEVQVQGIILKKYTDDTNPLAKGPHSVVHCPPVQMGFKVEVSSILVESSNHDGVVSDMVHQTKIQLSSN